MQQLTVEGRRIVDDVSQRHGFSSDAVTEMLRALSAGYGSQAQFSHMEFGGMGQWSQGGMVMIGDMFNNSLKGRVSALCDELSGLIKDQPMFAAPRQSQTQSQGGELSGQVQSRGNKSGSSLFVSGSPNAGWWPAGLGSPGSVGSQNNLQYAYFPVKRRLAINIGGKVTVYDTGEHQISGFSQQQSGDQSLTFTSQFGLVLVGDLPQVSEPGTGIGGSGSTEPSAAVHRQSQGQSVKNEPIQKPGQKDLQTQPSSQLQAPPALAPAKVALEKTFKPENSPDAVGAVSSSSSEIFSIIEQLAVLRDKGILTEAEFEAKKVELLGRL